MGNLLTNLKKDLDNFFLTATRKQKLQLFMVLAFLVIIPVTIGGVLTAQFINSKADEVVTPPVTPPTSTPEVSPTPTGTNMPTPTSSPKNSPTSTPRPTPSITSTPKVTITPTPVPTCRPKPSCLDDKPFPCKVAVPKEGWCKKRPTPFPTPTVAATATPKPTTSSTCALSFLGLCLIYK